MRIREEDGLRKEIEEMFARLVVPIEWSHGFHIVENKIEELRTVDTPEKQRARSRAWKVRNRERVAAYSRARYLARKAA